MFFPTDPLMKADVVVVAKLENGYQVTISENNNTVHYGIESEDRLLDLLSELITGGYNAFDESKIETPVH